MVVVAVVRVLIVVNVPRPILVAVLVVLDRPYEGWELALGGR